MKERRREEWESGVGKKSKCRGSAHLGALSFVLDHLSLGFSLSLRSLAWLGSRVLASGDLRSGPGLDINTLSVSNFAAMGPLFPANAGSCFGSFLSILDLVCLDSSLSLQSLLQLGSSAPARDHGQFGSPLSLHGVLWMGLTLPLKGFAAAEASPLTWYAICSS